MRIVLTLAWVLLAFVPAARADVPGTISYQGLLTDAVGTPVADDDYSIRFRLYDPALVWEETQTVTVTSGRFSVLLGSVVPIDPAILQGAPLSLGIKVGDDSELSPWTPLTSVPYALTAAHATTAESVTMSPTTRYHTVCAEAFTPNSSATAYTKNSVRVYPTAGTNISMGAVLTLPHGAQLTELHVLFEDAIPDLELSVGLRRVNVTDGTLQTLGVVASGIPEAAGLTIATRNLFLPSDIVDNQNWAYSLQAFWSTAAGLNLSLRAVRITYTVTEPLP
jgi:hypothetical protein